MPDMMSHDVFIFANFSARKLLLSKERTIEQLRNLGMASNEITEVFRADIEEGGVAVFEMMLEAGMSAVRADETANAFYDAFRSGVAYRIQ
jgi:hypothetical protein